MTLSRNAIVVSHRKAGRSFDRTVRGACPSPCTAQRGTGEAARRIGAWLLFALTIGIFIGALEWTYAVYMAPRFGYLGWVYTEPSRRWMLATYLILLVAAAFLPYRTRRISGFAVWFLFVAMLIPVATVPLFGSTRDPSDTFLFGLYCTATWIGVTLIVRRTSTTRVIPVRSVGTKLFWAAIITLSFVTYVLIQLHFGLQFNIVSLFEVYDTRLLYRDTVVPTVPFLGYLISNQGNVINPLLMALGVLRRRPDLLAMGIVGQLLLYSTTGYRTSLISVPLSIAIALVLRYRPFLNGHTVAVSATALVWFSIAADRIMPLGLVDIVVSRIFLTAGYLIPHYRTVYDDAPAALWDYSFLGPLVDAPYTQTPGFHVATMALNRPDVQLNAGLFADGYANAHGLGIAIEALALIAILMLVDSASRGLPIALTLPTALLPVFSLANGSPFTAFLSYGFGLAILLFALAPRDPSFWSPKVPTGSMKKKRSARLDR